MISRKGFFDKRVRPSQTKSSLLLDFRRGAQRVPPVCFGMLLGSNGNRWRASRPVSTRPRRPCPPSLAVLKSNFKETMVSDLSSPLFPQRKGVHPVFSHPSFQLPQRGRQITACRDWRSNNETDASSLGDVCFLIATFVQRMRPRAQLCKLTRSLPLSSPYGPTFGCSISTFPKGLDSVNLKNPV